MKTVFMLEDTQVRVDRLRQIIAGLRIPEPISFVHRETVNEAFDGGGYQEAAVLFLDHDLCEAVSNQGDCPNPTMSGGCTCLTGRHFVQSLIREGHHQGLFIIHSQNPYGARVMMEDLTAAGFEAILLPYSSWGVNIAKLRHMLRVNL